jgi:UDP-N-acetylmuramate dehydrogenase
MSWYSGLENIVERDIALSRLTTFRIGGHAGVLLVPEDVESFAAAYAAAKKAGVPVHILGWGSNILVADEGVPGVVISTRGLINRTLADDGQTIRVEAGASMREFVRWSARAGYSGIESLAGIPGSIGGAVVMNAGALGACLGDSVSAVWYVTEGGELVRRSGEDISWDYRETDIDGPVAAVEMELTRDEPDCVLDRMADALMARRSQQPVGIPSAGCFFRNPPGESAGRLIDEAGLKGMSVGGASISARHANFIVNQGGATAAHVCELGDIVRDRVRDCFGVELKNEVCVWPSAVA